MYEYWSFHCKHTGCFKQRGVFRYMWILSQIILETLLISICIIAIHWYILQYPVILCGQRWPWSHCITKTNLFKYIENFTTKNRKFSDKNSDIFYFSAQNMDCGYSLELPHWGSSKEYPQSMFLSRDKKNNVYPCKPQFYHIKVGFKWVI